ncbi:MAG: 5' nucleotidase, NT5C type [Halanaerobium sp.]
MKYNFGIDIDGVLTDEGPDHNSIWQQKMNEFFDREITLKKDTYDLRKAFAINDQELNNFIQEKIEEIYSSVKAVDKARETLTELYEQGHNLILITARDERHRALTENWLKENAIPYHELYHEHNKAPLAVEKNISLFIDDRKENALEIAAKNIPVILISKYHNSNFKGNEKITKVNNWDEIKENIELFFSKNAHAGKLS